MSRDIENLELRRNLIEYLGLTGTLFNSGLVERGRFKTENEEKTALVHTWFLPPKARHVGGQVARIGCWLVDSVSQPDIQIKSFGKRPSFLSQSAIFLPETLTDSWAKISDLLGEPQKIYTGYLTSGGRSFWLVGSTESFGIKFDTLTATENDRLNKRTLDEQMIENTVFVSQRLADHEDALYEGYGEVISFQRWPEIRFSYILRDFKWNDFFAQHGDVFVPISMLLSEAFWAQQEIQRQMGIAVADRKTFKSWFIDNCAGFFAEMMTSSLFETGIHPEAHQQNITVHLRDGQVVGLFYHDLQDCLLDPMSIFLQENQKTDKADFSIFSQKRLLGFPGEVMTRHDPQKLYISLSDWWRRWLRVFGQYDRLINILSGEEPFLNCDFEKKITQHLCDFFIRQGYSDFREEYDLYQMISWCHHKHQQRLLDMFISKNISEVQFAKSEDFFNAPRVIASARAPWSWSTLQNWEAQQKSLRRYVLHDSDSQGKEILIFCGDIEINIYFVERA